MTRTNASSVRASHSFRARGVPGRPLLTVCGLVAICAAVAVPRAGGNNTPARSVTATVELTQRLLADVEDGQLNEFGLLEAALVAGGVTDRDDLDRAREAFDEACAGVQALDVAGRSPRQQASSLLRFLHRDVLRGEYRVGSSRLDRTLAEGHYNCVTATILFRCLCQQLGWQPVTVATQAHVFCRFKQPERFDVETTCHCWLELPADSELLARHPSYRTDVAVRELSDVELLGKIFYNRAVDQLERGQYATAVELLQTALRLDHHDRAASDNLLAAINNWSLERCRVGDFARAAELLEEGLAVDNDYGPLVANDLHVHQTWALSLCRQGQFPQALAVLESGHQRRPDAELFDRGRFAVYRLWAAQLFAAGRDREGWAVLQRARDQHARRPEWRQCEQATIQRAVRERMGDGEPGRARALLEQGLALQPDCAWLESQLSELARGTAPD